MRLRVAVTIATLAAALVVSLPGAAQARPVPADDILTVVLPNAAKMKAVAFYNGPLVDSGDGYCYTNTDHGFRGCMRAAYPGDWNNASPYPSAALVYAFPSIAKAMDHWRNHITKPQADPGTTIGFASGPGSTTYSYIVVPDNPDQMMYAVQAIRGRQGILIGECSANERDTQITLLAVCASRVAKSIADAFKGMSPRSPIG